MNVHVFLFVLVLVYVCLHSVALLGLIYFGGGIVEYPEVLQIFNDEIYPVRVFIQKSLIKVANYEIYGMKWGARPYKLPFAEHDPLGPPCDAYVHIGVLLS